jgi:hypothetical protein
MTTPFNQLVTSGPRNGVSTLDLMLSGDPDRPADGGGTYVEQATSVDFGQEPLQIVTLDDAQMKALSLKHVVDLFLAPPEKLVVATVEKGRSVEVYQLVEKRAAARFTGDLAFPYEVKDTDGMSPEAIMSFCATKSDGESFTPQEASVRWLLVMMDVLLDEDYKTEDVETGAIELTTLLDSVSEVSAGQEMQYLASLAVCTLAMAVAKPFVDRVTVAAAEMTRNMCSQLRLSGSHLNAETHRSMYIGYYSRVDLAGLARTLIGKEFVGAPWLTAYALRFGSGTSHLSLIASFIHEFADCPLWSYIPVNEVENFRNAVLGVQADPLLLFPTADGVGKVSDNFRVAGMKHIVYMATIAYKMTPSSSWGRYMNIQVPDSFSGLTTTQFSSLMVSWMQYKNRPTDTYETLIGGATVSEVIPNHEDLNLQRHMQTGGKKIPTLRGRRVN